LRLISDAILLNYALFRSHGKLGNAEAAAVAGLTGFGRKRAPAAVAVAENVVAELPVLLRRPQPLPVARPGLVARLAPHRAQENDTPRKLRERQRRLATGGSRAEQRLRRRAFGRRSALAFPRSAVGRSFIAPEG
jgi:hypothetical protein